MQKEVRAEVRSCRNEKEWTMRVSRSDSVLYLLTVPVNKGNGLYIKLGRICHV